MATMTDEDFIGMEIDAARVRARGRGLTLRVVSKNGKVMVVTRDYREDRLNVHIVEGIIKQLGRRG